MTVGLDEIRAATFELLGERHATIRLRHPPSGDSGGVPQG
jgi:hypothetical protein